MSQFSRELKAVVLSKTCDSNFLFYFWWLHDYFWHVLDLLRNEEEMF